MTQQSRPKFVAHSPLAPVTAYPIRMSALGPGCVKTCTSRECAELFSLFSSFDGDCQSGSFLIQCNRDKLSTLKFDVGVFTQPGSFATGSSRRQVRSRPLCPESGSEFGALAALRRCGLWR